MKKIFQRNTLIFIGVGLGLMAGYFYWYFVGCQSGSCTITSNPRNSSLYGGLMGGLFFSLLKKEK